MDGATFVERLLIIVQLLYIIIMNNFEKILEKLDVIENIIKKIDTEEKKNGKEIMNAVEVADYLGLSKSHIWKLTAENSLPFYIPAGRNRQMFERSEVDAWVQAAAVLQKKSDIEIEDAAQRWIVNKMKKY